MATSAVDSGSGVAAGAAAVPSPSIPPSNVPSPVVSNHNASRATSQVGDGASSVPSVSGAQTPTLQAASVASPALSTAAYGSGAPTATTPSQPQRIPSPPTLNNGRGGLEQTRQYQDLHSFLKQCKPTVVRQVIRDNWQACILGSEHHLSFLYNVCLHQASPATLTQGIDRFGRKMVKSSAPSIVNHLSASELDAIADQILAKVSNNFLDKALARRLETIEARRLVNALSRAERLGYDVRDIVAEQNEQVTPSAHHQAQMPQHPPPPKPLYSNGVSIPSQLMTAQTPHQVASVSPAAYGPLTGPHAPPPNAPPQPKPATPSQLANGIVFCSVCQRPCSGPPALRYHRLKDICSKPFQPDRIGKDVCVHCGCRFGSTMGLTYHTKQTVCGQYSQDVTIEMTNRLQHAASVVASTPAPPLAPNTFPMRPVHNTTPVAPRVFGQDSHPRPTSATRITPVPDDPYAHLDRATRERFEAEIAQGELHYGKLMRDASELPQPERGEELSKLKNRFNTRQSGIRKQYGIRLTRGRSKQEIADERSRLFLTPDGNAMWDADDGRPKKRMRTGSMTPTKPVASSQTGTPLQHLSVSQMGGGLSGSSATAELVDPTANLSSSAQAASQGLTGARHVTSSNPMGTYEDPMAIDSDTAQGEDDNETANEQDDSSSEEEDEADNAVKQDAVESGEDDSDKATQQDAVGPGEGEDDTDSDSDEDIPARLAD